MGKEKIAGMRIGIVPRGSPQGNHVIDRWRFEVLIQNLSEQDEIAIEYRQEDVDYDLLIVPLLLSNEKYFMSKSIPIVGDITDDIFAVPWHRLNLLGKIYSIIRDLLHSRKARFRHMIRACNSVVVGCESQRKSMARYNSLVFVVTDAVRANPYRKEICPKRDGLFRLVWIGNVESLDGLAKIQPVLDRLAESRKFELILITGNSTKGRWLGCWPHNAKEFLKKQNIACKVRKWDINTFEKDIADGDIGIVPVDTRSGFTLNKPAGRALLFMAAGLPVVATNIPAYREIINHRQTGYLANSIDDWHDAISELSGSYKKRLSIGSAGQNFALNNFSAEHFIERYQNILNHVFNQNSIIRAKQNICVE